MRAQIQHVPWIAWARVLLIALAGLLANAETGREMPESSFDLDWEISPSEAMVTLAIVCIFVFLVFIAVYCRHCSRPRVAAATGVVSVSPPLASSSVAVRPRCRGLDRAVIETLPVLTYSTVKGIRVGKEALECAVCLSEFEGYDTLRLLPRCNHVFHPGCIDTWLASQVTCPVCRATVAPTTDEPIADSSQATDSSDEQTQENSAPGLREEQNHVVIDVEEAQGGELPVVEIGDRPQRTDPSEKLPRAHSTGHSLVPEENTERYTLTLPEELRKQVLECGKLEHSTSYGVALAAVASSREGYRNGDTE